MVPISFSHIKKIICFILLFAQSILAQNVQFNAKELLSKVDSLMADGMAQKAFPGAQVLLYKNGKVLLNKTYGHHTYNQEVAVKSTHLYDLASVTKVLAGTLAFMKLYELYPFALDEKVSTFFPSLRSGNKKDTRFRAVLSHSAGWLPYITHQEKIYHKGGAFRWHTLSEKQSKRYPTPLNDRLYIHKNYTKKIMRRIKRTPVENVGQYRYSGLWFFLLPQLVKQISGLSLDAFLNTYFYGPMGLERIGFLPMKRFPKEDLVPTERDSLFRKELVQGWVHDEAAGLMGGISGNAGLFANAESIAPLLTMLLHNGQYQGKNYLRAETIAKFTSVAYPETANRRGLGFDKPELVAPGTSSRYPSIFCSPASFGHSGFTGTFIWVDPEHNSFLIFLSNRVYPSRTQKKLYTLGIRGKLLDYVIQTN